MQLDNEIEDTLYKRHNVYHCWVGFWLQQTLIKCQHNTNSGNANGERPWTTLLKKGMGTLPRSPLMLHKTPPFPTFY